MLLSIEGTLGTEGTDGKGLLDQAGAQALGAEEDTKLAVAEAYVNVLRSRKALEVAESEPVAVIDVLSRMTSASPEA